MLYNTDMDKAFERVVDLLGSTIVIVGFAVWLGYHTYAQRDYLSFISELAILLGFLILRGQNVQAKRFELLMRKDFAATKRIEKKL